MSTSIIHLQREILLKAIRDPFAPNYKALIVDEESKRLIGNVTKGEDDILGAGVFAILQIEHKRETQDDSPAVYFLSPVPHVVEWLRADLNRRRYSHAVIIWASQLRNDLQARIQNLGPKATPVVASFSLNADFFPRESHLVTFGHPESFQILFNRHCDGLIRQHLDLLTRQIISVCVSLGEYPLVRFYRPRNPKHDASVLCTHLAKFVQDGIDNYARNTENFPPASPRPRATLLITDRSMDLMAPLVHELTYQAMAMDLLPMKEEDEKISYPNSIARSQSESENQDFELNDNDTIWVENRHLHMKDLLVKLSEDFKKFQAKNSQFADHDDQHISVNTIKDMLAGLPEFQEGKDAFSIHIDMAEKCAKIFQEQKLLDVTSIEQSLATGLDEDNERPKNLADQLVRILDDDDVILGNRARLLTMYIMYRGGILSGDIGKLRKHGQLSDVHHRMIYNMEILGAKVWKNLADPNIPSEPLYLSRKVTYAPGEEVSLSRFEPMLRYALEELCQGNLDGNKFPPVKPHLDNQGMPGNTAQTSLRSAGKPTWASTRPSANKPRQRIIVFMAGGATYSEARVCYQLSHQCGKDIFLATTHMLTPKTFLDEVARLDTPRQELNLKADRGAPRMPAWMNEPPPGALQPQQPSAHQRPSQPMQPLANSMQNMSLGPERPQNGSPRPNSAQTSTPSSTSGSFVAPTDQAGGKAKKEKKGVLGRLRKH